MKYTYNFSVRFRDTDAYGIVHHSNYFCYFEEARYNFSEKVLKLYEQGVMTKLKFPVISAECIYKNALGYALEEYQVHLKFRILEGARIEFRYELLKENERKIYAKGRTVHAILNEEDKLCLQLPKSLQELKERISRNE
ncbi:MAG: acyl-CoA thioesterase [Anaerovoracaceae bacterium]